MRTYLDHNATSTLRPEAHKALARALAHSANPSSVHLDGQKARALVEDAREVLAGAIGRSPTEIVFTSGGTEACSLAIAGAVRGLGISRIVASAIEHAAVLEAARASGAKLEIAPVTTDGVVDLTALDALLADGNSAATLICVMVANNETGAIQPMDKVAGLARTHGALLFCDAVQALGKMPFDISDQGIDLAAFGAHKLGGPRGVGALFVRSGLSLAPIIRGGGQERGVRGGTENVAGIAGFAAAVSAAVEAHKQEHEHAGITALRGRLEAEILKITPEARIVANSAPRLANTSAIALPGALAETLVIALDLEGCAVSAGAACSSGKVGPSHVIAAMGIGPELEAATIRVSLGWNTTDKDIEAFVDAWARTAPRIVRVSSGCAA